MPKKLLAFVMIFAMIFSYFTPLANVFAASTAHLTVTFRDTNYENGKVKYSLDDGATWNDITSNTQNMSISVSGDNLRLKIVPNENYYVDYAGIEMRHDENAIGGLSSIGLEDDNGYAVPSNVESVELKQVEFGYGEGSGGNPEFNAFSNVNIHIEGTELEYDAPWSGDAADFSFGINNSPEMRRLAKNEVNYIIENNEIVGLDTKEAISYQYDYNNEGTVTFHIRTQIDDVITSLKINNVLYNTPQTKAELAAAFSDWCIEFDIENVPYSETYNIEVTGRKQTEEEKLVGNFAWTYDENSNEYSEDDKILHGTLDFVKAEYGNHTYTTIEQVNNAGNMFVWEDGIRDTDNPTGEALFPTGTVLTLRLTPDAGYQLTSFDLNGTPFEPGEDPGLYTFTIKGGNWHLGAHFTEVGNEVKADSNKVSGGSISTNEQVQNGTIKLEVSDTNVSNESRIEFENRATADGYTVDNYLDLSLYNSIYKGGKKDVNNNYLSWDTAINDLENNASITLNLEDNMQGKDVAIIHEVHDGNQIVGYDLINANYNSNDNSITFETDSFSNYAIVTKGGSEQPDNPSGEKMYTVEDENHNKVTFKEEQGHAFHLNIIDYLKFTKEEVMAAAGITGEEYDQVFNGLKEATKKYGTMLSLYEITVTDENDHELADNIPVTLRLKITPEMKDYDSFKLIYVKDDFTLGEITNLTKQGDYLVANLPHLSVYTLVGEKSNSNSDSNNSSANVQTGDNIYLWIGTLAISLIGASSIFVINRRQKNN